MCFFLSNQEGLVQRAQTEALLFPGHDGGVRWAICFFREDSACLNGACDKIFWVDPPVTLLGMSDEWKCNRNEIHHNTHYP